MFYAYDGLGSVAALSNHQGKLKTRYQYDAFGEVLTGDLSDNQYAFTGRRLDPENNLYHFHFRKYDAEVGVWTTADPIGVNGGVNLYRYVKSNPINFIDILGLTTGGGNSAVGERDEFGSEGAGERQEGYGESFGDEGDNDDDQNWFDSLIDWFFDEPCHKSAEAKRREDALLKAQGEKNKILDDLLIHRDEYVEKMGMTEYLGKVHEAEESFDAATAELIQKLDNQRTRRREGECGI